jgi:glutamate racemase
MQCSNPIGIFDSGVGGLTVARAIKDLLPNESLYYIGDTANLPYGEKSTKQIQTYVKQIVDVLMKQGCKIIVIACSTATAAAAAVLQEHIGSRVPILNVIDPVIAYVKQHYAGKTLGLIGTQYTVNTDTYVQKLEKLQANIQLECLATPLLVPMIEADQYEESILQGYLSQPILADIKGLILGCTHYWLIKKQIMDYYQAKVDIINGAQLLAMQVQQILFDKNISNGISTSKDSFMATQYTNGFESVTERLFGEKVHIISLSEKQLSLHD